MYRTEVAEINVNIFMNLVLIVKPKVSRVLISLKFCAAMRQITAVVIVMAVGSLITTANKIGIDINTNDIIALIF